MFCKNCGNEIREDEKFCSKCGYDIIEKSHDLDCVTKISTPLFLLFSFLTLGIYAIIKWYRITGDIRKISVREETVSPLIITTGFIISLLNTFVNEYLDETSTALNISTYGFFQFSFGLLFLVCSILIHCHVTYHTLNNIKKIARIKQNKDLKYNKFWAFICGLLYINFVLNTYDQRLVENIK